MPEDIDPELLRALEEHAPDFRGILERHVREPDLSYSDYSHSRKRQLGKQAIEKTRIYLDQRYWIFCRDASLGQPQRLQHAEIWDMLCALVDSGQVICPATYPIFVETLKQGDLEKRRATATVVDRLSAGFALQPHLELMGNELFHFIRRYTKGVDAVYPLSQQGWTFPAWIVGERVPVFNKLDGATNNLLQKCAFDTLASLPFSAVIRVDDEGAFPANWDTADHYRNLNDATKQHRHEVTSYEKVFLSEVAGVLDSYSDFIPSVIAQIFEHDNGRVADMNPNDAAETVRLVKNMIYNLYLHKKISVDLPLVHVIAGIHAAVRYRQQPYKGGDHWDQLHAHQALGYCNAFFTESNLGNLLCGVPLRYDAAYGCRVLWKDDAVIAYLRTL